jgi:ketosteroid isomerase-like protein
VTTTALQSLLDLLDGFQAKDVEAILGLFAPDAVFTDPHYHLPSGRR